MNMRRVNRLRQLSLPLLLGGAAIAMVTRMDALFLIDRDARHPDFIRR